MSSSNKLHIQVLPHAQDTATFAKLNFRLHLYFWNVQLVTVYDLIIREGFSQLPKDSRWFGLDDGEPSQGQGVSGPRGDSAQQRAGVGPLLRPSLRPRSRGASDLQGTVSGVPPALLCPNRIGMKRTLKQNKMAHFHEIFIFGWCNCAQGRHSADAQPAYTNI